MGDSDQRPVRFINLFFEPADFYRPLHWRAFKCMDISYDPTQNEKNIAERKLSFEMARDFEVATALIIKDLRQEYPERRFQALGYIEEQLHMLVFTSHNGKVHVISLRKANSREVKRYEQKNQ
jgi:uncharacterized protein